MAAPTLPSFAYTAPTIVWFAPEALGRLGSYLKRLGISRAFLVCDPALEPLGIADQVRGAAAERVGTTWAHVEADAPRASVEAGADAARAAGADGVIALGGGSAIDSAKAIALLVKHGGDVARWDGAGKIGSPGLPLIAIPTTAGTGSEASCIAVLKDEAQQKKLVLIDRAVYPSVAILDPRLTMGLPAKLTAATGLDALTHAVEGIVSKYAQPVCDAIGLECVRLIAAHLRKAVVAPDDATARGYMLLAASMAGQLVSMTFTGVAHAVAHALGVGWRIHHGTANALVLPWSIRFNASDGRAAAGYRRCAEAFGVHASGDDAAWTRAFADAVEAFVAELGLPTRLGAIGVGRDELGRLAALAFADPSHGPNPVKVSGAAQLEAALADLA